MTSQPLTPSAQAQMLRKIAAAALRARAVGKWIDADTFNCVIHEEADRLERGAVCPDCGGELGHDNPCVPPSPPAPETVKESEHIANCIDNGTCGEPAHCIARMNCAFKEALSAAPAQDGETLAKRLGALFVLALQSRDPELREAAFIDKSEIDFKDGPRFLPVLNRTPAPVSTDGLVGELQKFDPSQYDSDHDALLQARSLIKDAADVIDKMAERIGELEQQLNGEVLPNAAERSKWRGIESAPRDGTRVLLYCERFNQVCEGMWSADFGAWGATWIAAGFNQPWKSRPTHWQLLPPPPDREGQT